MMSLFYLFLAILGLSFLIFIHELGHYIVGRIVGMKIEVFSIGFGRPLLSWRFQGVQWQIGILPFGGYVRFAGMEKKGNLEPHQIPNGFFGKSPYKRIAVALAGPFVNIVFALFAFTCIWIAGGQEKPFSSSTNMIGFVDASSKLYTLGVRPGDQFTAVDGQKIQGFQDLAIALMLNKEARIIEGQEIDYASGKHNPFTYHLESGIKPTEALYSLGVSPAQYLMFKQFISKQSPMSQSGLKEGDRIAWVNGERIFSNEHLSSILNSSTVLLTVENEGQIFLRRAPLVAIGDLQISSSEKEEFDDWRYEASLNSSKTQDLLFIPYNLTHDCFVEESLSYLNQSAQPTFPEAVFRDPTTTPLQSGDRIIAVWGFPVSSGYELLKRLQVPHAVVIVQKPQALKNLPKEWNEADHSFQVSLPETELATLTLSVGIHSAQKIATENLILLPPVELKSIAQIPLDPKTESQSIAFYKATKAAIEKIDNAQEREIQLQKLQAQQKRLVLGISTVDRPVTFNPSPLHQFSSVLKQTGKTLINLFSGNTSPKYMSGPIGIVQALQFSWETGIKEAFFWLGFVSLNLAILNLLPIPVLDGGHVVFSLIEAVTKKPIKPKTMEKLVIPFVILLILFFIYVTYNDVIRIFIRMKF